MKFLWESNAPWAGTGYGAQTKLVVNALREFGHEPSVFAFYGLSGGTVEYDGYPVLPNSDFESWGNDVIKAHIERTRSDAAITLMDLFVLRKDVWEKLGVPWLAWTPIDSDGIGKDTLEILKLVDFPVAMSLHGKEQMENHDVEVASMIYHAVDTDTFVPMDTAESRYDFMLDEDAYVVGLVMANKGDRKQYPLQLKALKIWMDQHKDEKIFGYIHTEPTAQMGGWDMRELVKMSGLEGKVFATNQYDVSVVPLATKDLAKLFNCFDVLMNVSAGEGFGIPIVEAQACGVPVITHGVTSMPELTHNGYTVESAMTGLASHMGWQYAPSVDDMVYRLECVYRMTDNARRAAGRDWVVNNCSLPVVASAWHELLTDLDDRLKELRAEARVEL